MLLLGQAAANFRGDDAGRQQPPFQERVKPQAATGDHLLVDIATDDGLPHFTPDSHRSQTVASHNAPPDRKRAPAAAPKRAEKRPMRPSRRQTGATTPHVDGDRTVHLCATIGERGSTVSVYTRRQTDRRNLKDGESGSNILTLSATDGPAPSAKLSLTVRMAASSPQITVKRI
jgi:hypothetical protein